MADSTITWGTIRDGNQILCTVFCYVCREVFARGVSVSQARETKTDIDEQGHTCGSAA